MDWTSHTLRAMSWTTRRRRNGADLLRTPPACELERGCGGDGAMLSRRNRQEAKMTKLTNRNAARAKFIHPKLLSFKLTDAQLIVLSGAAQRKDRAATVPEGMKDSAAHKLGTKLIEKGLAREVRAKSGMPVWRRSGEGGSLALIITKLGRSTIEVEDGIRMAPTQQGSRCRAARFSRHRRWPFRAEAASSA